MNKSVNLIIEGLSKINESPRREYMVSRELLKKTQNIYNKLQKILNPKEIDSENDDAKRVFKAIDLVKDAFRAVGGKCATYDQTATYFRYDGSVKNYTIGGSVSLKSYTAGDLNRLAEDLTMAFYTNNGGGANNTMDLIDFLNGKRVRYGSEFVIED